MNALGRGLGGLGLSVALALAGSGASRAADRIESVDTSALRVCADPAAAPFSSQDGRGFENRIAELFARELGVPVHYTWFPSITGFYRLTLNARRCDLVIGAATGADIAQTTIPYYRSTYVLVTRAGDSITARTLDDPTLRALEIGIQTRTPPSEVLARAGMLSHVHSYDLIVDSRIDSVARRLLDDLAAKRIDAAVIWGPSAGYFADLRPGLFRTTPLAEAEQGQTLAFDISMAVRFGEPKWRARVDKFIRDNRGPIRAILRADHVPLASLPGDTP